LWAKKVKALASEKQVGFFDLEQAWGAAILAGTEPYPYYLRDDIHANVRGQRVLAAIFQQFFRPTSD
jgi:lysophospholipase L1-like esterase